MQHARGMTVLLLGGLLCGLTIPASATPLASAAATCVAPSPAESALASPPAPTGSAADSATPASSSAPVADAGATRHVIAGIENFVACRNVGDYAAYAALLTPNRVRAEAGTSNPADVVAGLQAFNLPITIVTLDDVRVHPDGRYSAEFVHLFGPHLYYRSRIFVVDDAGIVRFDEEEFLPEEPAGEQVTVDVWLTDFAIGMSQETIANTRSVVLRGQNAGSSPHDIVVVQLPDGVMVEQALSGEIPEDQIAFIGRTTVAPGASDDLVLVNLEPGDYTLLCLVAGPDGVPHAAKGMVAQMMIEGVAAPTP